jgi:hypothetical protein
MSNVAGSDTPALQGQTANTKRRPLGGRFRVASRDLNPHLSTHLEGQLYDQETANAAVYEPYRGYLFGFIARK